MAGILSHRGFQGQAACKMNVARRASRNPNPDPTQIDRQKRRLVERLTRLISEVFTCPSHITKYVQFTCKYRSFYRSALTL